MKKPNLIRDAEIKTAAFALGKVDLVYSEELGCMVYGGKVSIPRVLPESVIRIVQRPEGERQNEKSPDFDIEVLASKEDGSKEWQMGAGIAWWRYKDGNLKIDLGLNIGFSRDTVWATFWPADDDHQPEEGQEPEGYDADMGPIVWRLTYKPTDPNKRRSNSGGANASSITGSVKF